MKKINRLLICLLTIVFAGTVFAQAPAVSAKKPAPAKSAPPPSASTARTNTADVTSATKLPTEQTVDEFMRHMFGYDPSIKWKVAEIKSSEVPNVAEVVVGIGDPPQRWTLYVTPDGQHAFVGEVVPFGGDPFGSVRKELQTKATGPAKGPANAPVTIVEFSDLQCPHCKQAHPTLERLSTEVPNLKLVFENFPIDQIHKWANLAARYGYCVSRTSNDSFWRYLTGVFNQQDQITEQNAPQKLGEIAQAAGSDPAAIATCAESADAKSSVIQSFELGKSLGVVGTPTLFLNGRKIANVNGVPYDQLKAMVQFEAQQGSR